MKEITVEAKVEELDAVLSFIDVILEEYNCSMKTQMQIDIAVEEIFVNVAHYAYAPETGDCRIGVDYSEEDNSVSICFTDSGVPYNPLEKEDPDVTLSAEERQIGGLGIFMVKKSMDDMQYEYKDGCNILRIKKLL